MPTQSSLAAGVLQTAMRLSISVGLSVTSAAYGSIASTNAGKENVTLPYKRAYVCGVVFSTLAMCFVPFMKIGRQGKKSSNPGLHKKSTSGFSLHCAGSTMSAPSSLTYKPSRTLNSNRFSVATIRSECSVASAVSWEHRWSSEVEEDRFCGSKFINHDEMMVHEVCTKCLDEIRSVQRKAVVGKRFSGDSYSSLSTDVEIMVEKPEQVYRHTWSGVGGFGPMSPLVVRDESNAGLSMIPDGWI